jgi:O-antigen ligase
MVEPAGAKGETKAERVPPGGYLVLTALVGGAVAGGGHLAVTQGVMVCLVAVGVFSALRNTRPLLVEADRAEKALLWALAAGFMVAAAGMIPLPAQVLDFISPFTAWPWHFGETAQARAVSVVPETTFECLVLAAAGGLGYFWGRTYLAPGAAKFLRLFFYSAAAVAAISVALYATGMEPTAGLPANTSLRLRGFFSNPNRFAVWMSMALIAGTAWYLDKERPERENIICLAGLGALFAAITLTASRGTFIALAPVAVLMLWTLRKGDFRGRLLFFMGAMPVAGLIAAAFLYPRLMALPDEVKRADVWLATLGAAADFPILGSGLGTFGEVFSRYQPQDVLLFYRHAHNEYAEILLELGVVGFFVSGTFAYYLYRGWRKVFRSGEQVHSPYGVAGLAAVSAAAISSIYDFPLRQPANLVLFSILFGMTAGKLALYRRHRPEVKPLSARWKWMPAAVVPFAILVAIAGGLRTVAGISEPGRALWYLKTADKLEPGAGDNLRAAAEIAYKRFWSKPSAENFNEAIVLTSDAVRELPYDPFTAYRGGVMAMAQNELSTGDYLVARCVEMGRAYAGIRQSAAVYFFRRYQFDKKKSMASLVWMAWVLRDHEDEIKQWAERLLDAGLPEKHVRVIVGPEASVDYISQLFVRRMWKQVIELTGPASSGMNEAMPLRAAALVMTGEEAEGMEILRGALIIQGGPGDEYLKMAASALPDAEGRFLSVVAGKLSLDGDNLKWLVSEAEKRKLHTPALAWSAGYVHIRNDAWGHAAYARALKNTGNGKQASQVIFEGVERFPDDASLWQEAAKLEESGTGDKGLLEHLLDLRRPPVEELANIAIILARKGRDTAVAELVRQAAADREPDNPALSKQLERLSDMCRKEGIDRIAESVDRQRAALTSEAREGTITHATENSR